MNTQWPKKPTDGAITFLTPLKIANLIKEIKGYLIINNNKYFKFIIKNKILLRELKLKDLIYIKNGIKMFKNNFPILNSPEINIEWEYKLGIKID